MFKAIRIDNMTAYPVDKAFKAINPYDKRVIEKDEDYKQGKLDLQ